jgi:hypothetical protein
MRATLQPCALTHSVWAGNFFKKIDVFFPACTRRRRPYAVTHRVYEVNFERFFFIFFPACTGHRRPCAVTTRSVLATFISCWGHEEPSYIRMLYYEHEAGNSVRRFEVRSEWIRAGKTSKEEGQGGGG